MTLWEIYQVICLPALFTLKFKFTMCSSLFAWIVCRLICNCVYTHYMDYADRRCYFILIAHWTASYSAGHETGQSMRRCGVAAAADCKHTTLGTLPSATRHPAILPDLAHMRFLNNKCSSSNNHNSNVFLI